MILQCRHTQSRSMDNNKKVTLDDISFFYPPHPVPHTHLNTNLVNCSNVVTDLSAGFAENLLLNPGLHMYSSLYTCTVGVD